MNELLRSLRRRAQDEPGQLLLEGEGEALGAAEVLARVEELALALRGLGVSRVALYADNSPGWAVVDLACQSAQVCLVPLPTFFSPSQLEHTLTAAGVELVIHAQGLSPAAAALPAGPASPVPGVPGFLMRSTGLAEGGAIPPGTGKITFTSGSTGVPKGVCLATSQCLQVASALVSVTGVQQPRHLCVLPLSTLLENIGGIYMPLLAAGSAVLVSPAALGLQGSAGVDGGRFLRALHHYRPDTLILVPELLAQLDAALQAGWQAPASLTFVAVGGARVAPAMLARCRAAGLPVYEGYGLSECASVVSLNCPRADREGSSGRVLPHVQVSEVDGELVVAGNSFLGYLGQPDSWGQQRIHTGDIGTVDEEGFVTVRGRRRNRLITSFGRNVNPEWVESELLGTGLFRQAWVLGEGRPSCAALLCPVDSAASDSALQAAVGRANARLPDYARIGPWLRLDAPLTPRQGLLTANGRPRREAIARRFAARLNPLYRNDKEQCAL